MSGIRRAKRAARRLLGIRARRSDALVDATRRLESLQEDQITGSHPRRNRALEKAAQLQLSVTYQQVIAAGAPLPSLADAEMRFYSQSGEDGIIQLLLAATGTQTRRAVEICAGDGVECNSANLIVNHGWTGLLVDGGDEILIRGRRFYEEGAQTWYWPPVLKQAWVTRDNINKIVIDAGFDGDIDLLSIDLDGVDYWIWEALTVITPRVVVLEYQDILGPDRSWTVPYSDDFDGWRTSQSDGMPNFAGASLRAFAKLGAAKGYRLVGVNRLGYNAFFVREDLRAEGLPTVAVEDCFAHPKVRDGMRERFPQVADQPWVEV
jgi:hypothetical protein